MGQKKIFIFLLATLSSGICFSQTLDKAKLDEYIQVMEANNKFMGNVLVY